METFSPRDSNLFYPDASPNHPLKNGGLGTKKKEMTPQANKPESGNLKS